MNKIIENQIHGKSKLSIKDMCVVLLSTYNGEKYVARQIESILKQELVNCKLVIRDDGSSDDTKKIIHSLQAQYPSRIELIDGKNVGIHDSFKELMLNVPECEYVAFSDQDDIWDSDKLIIAITCLKKYNMGFYSCASRMIDAQGEQLNKTTSNSSKYKYYMCGNSILLTPGAQGCTMVVKKSLFQIILEKGIPSNYGHDTWIPIIAYFFGEGIYDSNAHMSYRQHDNSWTGNRKRKLKQLFVEIRYYLLGLSRYKPLAKDILASYFKELSDKNQEILESFASDNLGIKDRFLALRKYKFGKYGHIENIVFKIYYLFFSCI